MPITFKIMHIFRKKITTKKKVLTMFMQTNSRPDTIISDEVSKLYF